MNRCKGNCIKTIIVLILTVIPLSLKSGYLYAAIKPQPLQLTTFVSGTFSFLVSIPPPGKRIVGFFDMPSQSLILPNLQATKETQEPPPCIPEIDMYTTSPDAWANHSSQATDSLSKQEKIDAIHYDVMNFTVRKNYFNPTVRIFPSLNLLFWDGVLNHNNGTTLLNKPGTALEPEPAPIGLLGVGIVGIATATRRNKNKSAPQAPYSW